MLDKRDFAPIGYQRINKTTGKEVAWGDIVKGYEYKKNEYVALSDADFKHANIKATETIDIDTFCDIAEIPPMYYDTPYYLRPGSKGQKVFRLLMKALQATNKAAVATFVMRGRQHLCVVTPQKDSLMLITLRFSDEILPTIVSESAPSIAASELDMAKKLIEQMSGRFKPEQFKDTYKADLKRRIQEKIKKRQVHVLETPEPAADRPKAEVIDLMAALKASLKRKSTGTNRAARSRSAQR